MTYIYRIAVTHDPVFIEATDFVAAMELLRARIQENAVPMVVSQMTTVPKLPDGEEFLR